MERLSASEVLERTIAIIPWVAESCGGYATFAEISARFAIDPDDAQRCMEVASMVGTDPYTPDTLIDIQIDPEGVWVTLPDYFRRPLRPSPEQTFLLLTAATVLTQLEGASASGALRSALAKIMASLGDSTSPVEIEIDPAPDGLLSELRAAIDLHRTVTIEQYSFGSDEVNTRDVDPWRLQQSAGHWYLQGWCHARTAERVFRVDRIRAVEIGDGTFDRPDPIPPFVAFAADRVERHARLRLAPTAGWVLEYYPHEVIDRRVDGSVDIDLAVGSTAWLERVLLRLGGDVEVLEVPDDLRGVESRAARSLLRRYRK